MKIGYVYFDEMLAGKIIQDDNNEFIFEYDDNLNKESIKKYSINIE